MANCHDEENLSKACAYMAIPRGLSIINKNFCSDFTFNLVYSPVVLGITKKNINIGVFRILLRWHMECDMIFFVKTSPEPQNVTVSLCKKCCIKCHQHFSRNFSNMVSTSWFIIGKLLHYNFAFGEMWKHFKLLQGLPAALPPSIKTVGLKNVLIFRCLQTC